MYDSFVSTAAQDLPAGHAPHPPRPRVTQRISPLTRAAWSIGFGLLALFVAIVLSLALGSKSISPLDVLHGLFGQGEASVVAIVGQLRLNRTIIGLICGAALGLAGCLMQALTRNPIADPGILGVNAGASLGVAIGVLLTGTLSVSTTVWFAMAGAAAAASAVFFLSASQRGDNSPIRLTLSGVALGAILGGITQAVVLSNEKVLDVFRFWQVGSLTARTFSDALPIIPVIAVGVVLALALSGPLNALALGDDSALSLGSNPARTRILGLITLTILSGCATALAGPISFIGLITPHIIRRITGPDMRILLPTSMLAAPALLLISDTIGRLIGGGAEVSVGIVTAFIGGPLLIVLLSRTRLGRSA